MGRNKFKQPAAEEPAQDAESESDEDIVGGEEEEFNDESDMDSEEINSDDDSDLDINDKLKSFDDHLRTSSGPPRKPKSYNALQSDSDNDDDDAEDQDEYLQRAFAAGQLQNGIHGLVALPRKPTPINSVGAMRSKLAQIKLDLDWLERLDLTCEPIEPTQEMIERFGKLPQNVSSSSGDNKKKKKPSADDESAIVENDYQREMLFYRQAQAAANAGLPRLKGLGVRISRPPDYFAQMIKSDKQMEKIRVKLVEREKSIELSERAKKLRHAKKYGKQIQVEVLKKRQAEKRELLTKIKSMRSTGSGSSSANNNNNNNNNDGGKDFDELLNGAPQPKERSGGKKSTAAGGAAAANKKQPTGNKANPKRSFKDTKYGFGGQKKRSKYNTGDSAAEMSSYRRGKHGKPPTKPAGAGRPSGRGRPGGGPGPGRGPGSGPGRGSKTKANRPGKARRAQMRKN